MYIAASVNLQEKKYGVTFTPRVTEHGHPATATRTTGSTTWYS